MSTAVRKPVPVSWHCGTALCTRGGFAQDRPSVPRKKSTSWSRDLVASEMATFPDIYIGHDAHALSGRPPLSIQPVRCRRYCCSAVCERRRPTAGRIRPDFDTHILRARLATDNATLTRQVQKSWDAFKVTLTQGNPNPRSGSSRADFVGYSVHTFTRPNLLSHAVRRDSGLTPLLPCDKRGGRVNVWTSEYPTKSARAPPDRGLGFPWVRVTL